MLPDSGHGTTTLVLGPAPEHRAGLTSGFSGIPWWGGGRARRTPGEYLPPLVALSPDTQQEVPGHPGEGDQNWQQAGASPSGAQEQGAPISSLGREWMKINASCNSLRAKGCPASPASPTRREAPCLHPVPSGHLGMQGEPEAPNCGAGPPPSQEPPRGPRSHEGPLPPLHEDFSPTAQPLPIQVLGRLLQQRADAGGPGPPGSSLPKSPPGRCTVHPSCLSPQMPFPQVPATNLSREIRAHSQIATRGQAKGQCQPSLTSQG